MGGLHIFSSTGAKEFAGEVLHAVDFPGTCESLKGHGRELK